MCLILPCEYEQYGDRQYVTSWNVVHAMEHMPAVTSGVGMLNGQEITSEVPGTE